MRSFAFVMMLVSFASLADTRILAIRQGSTAIGANVVVTETANGNLENLILNPNLAPMARSVIPFSALARGRTYAFRGPNNEILGEISGGQGMNVTTGGGLIISFRICGGGNQSTQLVLRQNSNNQWIVSKGGEVVETVRVNAHVSSGCTSRVTYE